MARGKGLWPTVSWGAAGAGPLRVGVGAATATAARDQAMPGAETGDETRGRGVRDGETHTPGRPRGKGGDAEADTGQLGAERERVWTHKEIKS